MIFFAFWDRAGQLKEPTLKHTIVSLTCTAALIASSVACSSGDDASTLPSNTSGSTSPTTTSRPVTTTPTATPSASTTAGSGPVALAANTTYTFGALTFIVNLPADIPAASRPSMRLFSEFLQGVGRTAARNKMDPSLSGLASADVMKERRERTGGESVQGIGSMTYTITTVQTNAGGTTLVTGCLDQSKLAQVRKDGSQFFDQGAREYPKLKMTANINRGKTGPEVTLFRFAAESC